MATWFIDDYRMWLNGGCDAIEGLSVEQLIIEGRYDIPDLKYVVLLKNLKILNIGGSSLKQIPEWVYDMVNLEILNIRDNNIEEISPNIKKLVNLKYFFCTGNKISSFPVEMCELKKLSKLCYGENALDILHPDVIEFIETLKNVYTERIIQLGI